MVSSSQCQISQPPFAASLSMGCIPRTSNDSMRAMLSRMSCWVLIASIIVADTSAGPFAPLSHWGLSSEIRRDSSKVNLIAFPRGGSSTEEEEVIDCDDDEDESTSASLGIEELDAIDDESSDENEAEIDGVQIEVKIEKFDEPFVVSPMSNLYASLGVMLLARKVDLFNPVIVRIARFAFISYLILQQLFLFYVRIQAKRFNDRTPVEVKNPLSGLKRNIPKSSPVELTGCPRFSTVVFPLRRFTT